MDRTSGRQGNLRVIRYKALNKIHCTVQLPSVYCFVLSFTARIVLFDDELSLLANPSVSLVCAKTFFHALYSAGKWQALDSFC